MKLFGMMMVAMMVGALNTAGCAKSDATTEAVAPEDDPTTAPVVDESQPGVEKDGVRFSFYAPFGPPAARHEAPTRPPSARHFWAPGYWRWTGRQHAWVGGRWYERRDRHDWVSPRWERRHNRWAYAPGHWARRR